MIKIMNTTKALPVLASDVTNGLGRIDPISCLVTEELNGIYECEFTLLATDRHFGDLNVGGIVKIPVNEAGNEQLFRIYFISKPMNQVVEVKCQHITYDLSKVPVAPFTATGSIPAKNGMLSHIIGSYPFTMTTDIENTSSQFVLDIPRSFRECLGGYEGSLLDTFRGEYEYDNLTVNMLARRGSDNGVRISYGKNLTDFTQEENNENVYTSVLGYAVVDGITYTGNVYHKLSSAYPKVMIVDFSGDYGEGASVPTVADLTEKAEEYADRNSIEVPRVNISVSFVPLYQTEEYKNIAPLERVSLGDTVHVYFEKLDVEASARVIKTVWNVNLNRYDSVELGDAKANLSTVINDTVDTAIENADIDIDTGFIEQRIQEISSLIANGMGLHISQDEAGRIILHNEETIEDSQYQYMISSAGFMLSEDYGQTWSSGWTTSGDAVLNSLSTITLRALEIYGSYIEGSRMLFGDASDKYVLVQPFDADNDGTNDGILFDGTGHIQFTPQESFIVYNRLANGNTLNSIIMRKATYTSTNSESTFFTLHNYATTGVNLANRLHMYYSSVGSSGLVLENDDVANGTAANSLYMTCATNTNRVELTNYFKGSSQMSAQIWMDSPSGSSGRINLYSYNSSGTTINSIVLSNDQLSIYGAGISIASTGSLYLTSGGSQDIHINAADDLYLSATDKIYFRGTQIGFRADGSLGQLT